MQDTGLAVAKETRTKGEEMRHIGNVLVGAMLVFAFLPCVLTLLICIIGALEHPESYWCGVAVAAAVAGLWRIGDVACSQVRSLLG
jgi:cytochrome c biogenesis protein CcdA